MKRTGLVVSCLALLVFGLTAASAQANWTHKGKGELKENASITFSGTLTLSTSAGNVSCPTSIGATLTASGSAGDVNSFTVSKPSECDLTGSLAAICGTNGVTKVEKTGTWTLTADESSITLAGIDIDYVLGGCLIPSFQLKGNATLSLDKASAIGTATFGGTQTLYNALGEESGTGELKGTLAVSPAGTYGVKTAATVETKWTDGDKQLTEDGKLTLSGTFSFSGSKGSVSCPATIKLLLESSTVEEEEAEGEVESFAVAKASECDVGGEYGSLCGTNSIFSVEQTGTATLSATKEDFTISGLVLDYKFSSCGITSLRVEGNPTVSVSTPGSIKSATFSAGSLEVFNAGGETTVTASAGGSASASPSGTYQLDADHHAETTETEETATTHTYETDNGPVDLEGTESFEGELKFKVVAGPAAGSTFGCQVTSHITGLGNEEGIVESFNPTTSTCVGTGVFAGCVLEKDTSNVPFLITTTGFGENTKEVDFDVTDDEGNITILRTYAPGTCAFGQATSHLEFASATVTPTISPADENSHYVNTLHVHALTTNGGALTTFGTLHKENSTSGLTLETTP